MNNVITLKNEYLTLGFYNAYNRACNRFSSRYSHCGYIGSLKDPSGKELLSMPTDAFVPLSGEGFPDEFEAPVGYNEALAGEDFIKIGVGHEKKLSLNGYTNHDNHPVTVYTGIAQSVQKTEAAFCMRDSLNGYSYRYEKRVSLKDNSFVIAHKLINNGEKAFKTLWYSHAFVPYPENLEHLTLTLDKNASLGGVKCNGIYKISLRVPLKGECIRFDTSGCKNNLLSLKAANGAYYTAEGDYLYDVLQVFINRKIISLEPMLDIALKAGEQKQWKTKYTISYFGD